MRNNVAPNGSSFEAGGTDGILYRLEWNGPATEWKWDIGISNTFAWSPDRRLFYFADSLANAIYRYRLRFRNRRYLERAALLSRSPARHARWLCYRFGRLSLELPLRRLLPPPHRSRRNPRPHSRNAHRQHHQLHLRWPRPPDPLHHHRPRQPSRTRPPRRRPLRLPRPRARPPRKPHASRLVNHQNRECQRRRHHQRSISQELPKPHILPFPAQRNQP